VYRALIVCNSSFMSPSLDDLKGPKADGNVLRAALIDHDAGVFEEGEVRVLHDAETSEVSKTTSDFFRRAKSDDILLFYYSGHGHKDDQDLFLCTRNTEIDSPETTALWGAALNRMIDRSDARAKVIILDCCHSALIKSSAASDIVEKLSGSGRYVLAATSPIEFAADGPAEGLPSPFTRALADALTTRAEDSDGDGFVDLEDVYRYLQGVPFKGATPHRKFEGVGHIPIARRPNASRRRGTQAKGDEADVTVPGGVTYNYTIHSPGLDVPYLERPAPGATFDPDLVAAFRESMRDEARKQVPEGLTDTQFLEWAGLIQQGIITYGGVLLFASRPTAVLPAAMVQCAWFHGPTRAAPHDPITDLDDSIPQVIRKSYDFVARVAEAGEAPSPSGPGTVKVYRYPMVALREIIANAVVHRDYADQRSSVQVHAFDERIEVDSPGGWPGAPIAAIERPLGRLVRRSERRNFRIAQTLSWSDLFEGLGAGVESAVTNCEEVGAPEPRVVIDDNSVKVIVFPQSQVKAPPQPRLQQSPSRTPQSPVPARESAAKMEESRGQERTEDTRSVEGTTSGRILGTAAPVVLGAVRRQEAQPERELTPVPVISAPEHEQESGPRPEGKHKRARRLPFLDGSNPASGPGLRAGGRQLEGEPEHEPQPVREEDKPISIAIRDAEMTQATDEELGRRDRRTHIWGSEIPFRNPHFIGREAELRALREQLTGGGPTLSRQSPAVLFGLGGIGKTQITTEYAHRYAGDYEVVWWVRADQEDTILSGLVTLGMRLGIAGFDLVDRDRSVQSVIDALQSGDPYSRWLLIFDDATRPERLRRYIPQGGHTIVTSRITEWRQVLATGGIEVREFGRPETIRFLRDRIPQLAAADDPAQEAARQEAAGRLAEVLGDLPLAAEHAASYLTQTAASVNGYIEDFKRDAFALLGESTDMFSSSPVVAVTWSSTRQTLSPEARELFQLLTFFAAEPIAEENLIQSARVALDPSLPAPLQKVLSSRIDLKRAQRELARFSLVNVYGQRNVVQLHPVVQTVMRSRIEKENPELAGILRATVFRLLAATDPDSPEQERNDPIYERTIRHLAGSGAVEADDRLLRNLIINQARRLRLRGRYQEALTLGESALENWRARPEDVQTLALEVEIAAVKRVLGGVEEAFAADTDALRRLREHYGEEDDTYLMCASGYGEDLRLLGRHSEALTFNQDLLPAFDRVFGRGQSRSLALRASIAADLRCAGRYSEALEEDRHVAAELEQQFGAVDLQTAVARAAVSADLRCLGRYEEALDLARHAAEIMESRNDPWVLPRLQAHATVSSALQALGLYAEGCVMAEDAHRRYVEAVGEEHYATLAMAVRLISARRVSNDLQGSTELGRATVATLEEIAGADHPDTLAACSALALTLRASGYPAYALEMNEATLDGYRRLYPYDHPNTLIVMANLASDLAATGEVRRARELGEDAVAKSDTVLGGRHPVTLAMASNLALDRRATGDLDAARELEAQSLADLAATLTLEHPVGSRAKGKGRLDLDVMPAL
jgi:tetratricopeptide (TPR) repeat protein